MTRIIHLGADNLSNRLPLGADTGAGSHGEGTQTYPHAENVIQFPSRFPPDSRAKSREPSIQVREFATCVFIGIFAGLVLVLFGLGYVGYGALIAQPI